MYKITVRYDENPVPIGIYSYSDALQAFESFAKYTDWGFANEYATYNLLEPNGKMHTKNFYRSGKVSGK